MKLEVIRGRVSNLHISQGEEDFVFSSTDKAAGAGAAIALAAGGLAGAATSAAYNIGDTTDKLDFFVCRVGEENVKGRFGKVSFVDSDTVEAVGSRDRGQFNAYAVTRPSDRTIWMYPHCSRGSNAYKKYCVKWIFLLSFIVTPAFMSLMFGMMIKDSEASLTWQFLALALPGPMFVMAIIQTSVSWRFMKYAHIADDIFKSLGFENPSDIDLPKRLKPTVKGLTNQERWNYHPQARWVFKY